jgi:hypothetical protein
MLRYEQRKNFLFFRTSSSKENGMIHLFGKIVEKLILKKLYQAYSETGNSITNLDEKSQIIIVFNSQNCMELDSFYCKIKFL